MIINIYYAIGSQNYTIYVLGGTYEICFLDVMDYKFCQSYNNNFKLWYLYIHNRNVINL